MAVSKPIRRLAAAALLMIGCADLAQAQDKPDNLLMRLFQPPASGSVPTPGGNATGAWSGQPGAWGDPRRPADATRAAAADFGNCLASLWPDAERRGVSRENFQRFTAGLTP